MLERFIDREPLPPHCKQHLLPEGFPRSRHDPIEPDWVLNYTLTKKGALVCFDAEDQRLAWCLRGQSKQTRRRLGKRWPMTGYNYYMAVNVVLANRGQPLLVLPLAEPWQPRPDLPLLSHTLSPQELKRLTESPQTTIESPGRAPPPSG